MSRVSERLMKPGSWEIELSPDTPEDVLQATRIRRSATNFAGFSTLLITETPIDPTVDAGAINLRCVYSGVYRTRRDGYNLSGAGLCIYLGDEDGKGSYVGTGPQTDGHANWVNNLRLPITAGTIASPAGTYTYEATGVGTVARDVLDSVCAHFGTEWRINHRGLTLDAHNITTLYGTDPVAYFRRGASDDPQHRVLTGRAGTSESVDDFTERLFLVSSDGVLAGTAGHPSAPEWMSPWESDPTPADRIIPFARAENLPQIAASSSMDDVAAARLGTEFSSTSITLDVDNYRPSDFLLGKFIGVYAPEIDIYDVTADQVTLGGDVCTPLTTRVLAVDWDIPQGAGVYLVSSNGSQAFAARTVTDLSDYVVHKPTPMAKLTCGALEPTWATAARRKYDLYFGG